MKTRLLQSVALPLFFVGPAMGADLPMKAPSPAAAYNWTGFYVGLNAGGAWGKSDVTTDPPCGLVPPNGGYFCQPGFGQNVANTVAAAGSGSMSGSGFTGGGQIGYNFQTGRVVLGVESDINAFRINASRQASANYPSVSQPAPISPSATFTINSSIQTDWLFTARGRVGGLVTDNLLAYATGGLAVTNLQATHTFHDSISIPGTGAWSGSKTKLGWTIGGGLEWALTRNWSVKAEYLYLNFGSVDAAGVVFSPDGSNCGYANAISTSADLTAHVARAGVNYRF